MGGLLSGCHAAAPPVQSPSVPLEPRHVQLLRQVHQAPRYVSALLKADLVATDVEWWVAGDSTRLPWAGTRRGTAGIDEFSRILGKHMRYTAFAVREYLIGPDHVTVTIDASGTARLSGRPFSSPVVRIYYFQAGRIVRVRSFYDTDAYARAMDSTP